MSGSSLDGLDFALCEFNTQKDYRLIKSSSIAYSPEWVHRLSSLPSTTNELSQLECDYTSLMSNMILDFLKGEQVNIIASHGHTLYHQPDQRYTYQLGHGGQLASKTDITVISDFRSQDMAKGGQGAPIAPVVEQLLFSGHDAYLNLGGICNVSLHKEKGIIAYDIGPCNQLLNALAAEQDLIFDIDGHLASIGEVIPDLLEQSLNHSYYQRPPPKSLDNSYTYNEFVLPFKNVQASTNDKLRTATELISILISQNIGKKTRSLFATGGGALNTFLMKILAEKLSNQDVNLIIPDKVIIESKEAILMALMGYLRLNEKTNVFKSVTGASSDTVAGSIFLAG